MIITESEGILTIAPKGRIDSVNAPEIAEEIERTLSGGTWDKIIFDAGELTYISSAGLRVLMSLRKKCPNLTLIEVSPEIYEILETTGFTELFNIRKKLKELSVEGCPVVGRGACGTVYRTDPETVVKVYKPYAKIEEVENERSIARKAFILGIPTAISYDMVRVGDCYATVFEMLDAKSFTELLKNDPDNFESYVGLFTEVIKSINEIEYTGSDLPSYKEKTFGRLEMAAPFLTKSTRNRLYAFLEEIPESKHLVHGDYHIGNILYRDGEPMLIDLDTLGVGDAIFEIANTYIPFCAFAEVDPKDNEKFFGIPYETAQRFFAEFLRLYFPDMDDKARADYLTRAKIIAYLHAMKRVAVFEDRERAEHLTHYWVGRIENILCEI